MRRDKTLKVCANHISKYNLLFTFSIQTLTSFKVSGDMRLQPNVGSDRSWVWKVAADYSEHPPTAETLAIRFANPESESDGHLIHVLIQHFWIDAALFKAAFEDAQKTNLSLSGKPAAETKEEKEEEKKEEEKEEAKGEEKKDAEEKEEDETK